MVVPKPHSRFTRGAFYGVSTCRHNPLKYTTVSNPSPPFPRPPQCRDCQTPRSFRKNGQILYGNSGFRVDVTGWGADGKKHGGGVYTECSCWGEAAKVACGSKEVGSPPFPFPPPGESRGGAGSPHAAKGGRLPPQEGVSKRSAETPLVHPPVASARCGATGGRWWQAGDVPRTGARTSTARAAIQ